MQPLGSVAIPLINGGVAWVDAADAARVSQYKWYRRDKKYTSYAQRSVGRVDTDQMHRFILKCPYRLLVDHRDQNGLNNCRSNLRLASPSQNNANQRKTHGTSRYKGVSFHKKTRQWRAQILARHLGLFPNQEAAALAYNAAAILTFGEFARLNDVPHDATYAPAEKPPAKSPRPLKAPQRIRKNRHFTPPQSTVREGVIVEGVDFVRV